jgi:hypothetical protein
MYKYYVFGHYPSSCLYLKHRPLYFLKQRFGDRIQSLKRCVLKNKLDSVLDKDKMKDNVQKRNICTNVPSSQTFRSYLNKCVPSTEIIIVICRANTVIFHKLVTLFQ